MEARIGAGTRVLMPGGAFSAQYVVVEVERSEGSVIIGKEVAPNAGAREVSCDRTLVVALADLKSSPRGPGIRYAKGDLVLQRFDGGFQIVTTLEDVPENDNLASVQAYAPKGMQVEGVVTPTPVAALVDPSDLLTGP